MLFSVAVIVKTQYQMKWLCGTKCGYKFEKRYRNLKAAAVADTRDIENQKAVYNYFFLNFPKAIRSINFDPRLQLSVP